MTDETQSTDKAAKKQAKALEKIGKKQAKAEKAAATAASGATSNATPTTGGLSPAERSAAAAERQVRLQRYRVLIGILTLGVALGTFLITTKPWQWVNKETTPASVQTEGPK